MKNSTPKKFTPQYHDDEYDIQAQWIKFARFLYSNVLKIEKDTELEFMNSRKLGKSFLERKLLVDKLEKCKQTKISLEKSAKSREFNLDEEDYNIINEKGFEYWFKYYDGFITNSYPHLALDKGILKD